MTTKNKFAHPPYLEKYDGLKAAKLLRTLKMLGQTCCRTQSVNGAAMELELLTSRPSQIRKCDLYFLRPVIEAINRLE